MAARSAPDWPQSDACLQVRERRLALRYAGGMAALKITVHDQPDASEALLRAGLAADDWVTIGASPYPELGDRLARSTVLAIPTPQHPTMRTPVPGSRRA